MKTLNAPPEIGRAGDELSRWARRRMEETPGDPLFLASWMRALFVHYEVDAEELQKVVPFELDLWEGKAIVSLVAFTIEGMRPFRGGRWTSWILAPLATHDFLNVRTYVKHGNDRGIYFLREFLPNRLAVQLGPRTFGLPYRYGATRYVHGGRHLEGEVESDGEAFRYRGTLTAPCSVAEAGSREEFLAERYSAFTNLRPDRPKRCFQVWHRPWKLAPVNLEIAEDDLIRGLGSWAKKARFIGANYSPGVNDVWMGWPRRTE